MFCIKTCQLYITLLTDETMVSYLSLTMYNRKHDLSQNSQIGYACFADRNKLCNVVVHDMSRYINFL